MPHQLTEKQKKYLRNINPKKIRKSRHVALEMIEVCPKCGDRGKLEAHFMRGKCRWHFSGYSIYHREFKDSKVIRTHCWLGKKLLKLF